jgi:hypothetical protein
LFTNNFEITSPNPILSISNNLSNLQFLNNLNKFYCFYLLIPIPES